MANEKKNSTPTPPAPATGRPPGVASQTRKAVHGPDGPTDRAITPVDRLREVLNLSPRVGDDDVINEAVERLRKTPRIPAKLPGDED